MISKQERIKIQNALPISKSNGYRMINEKLPHLTRNQISQAFLYDNRYKPEVIEAALEIIKAFRKTEYPLKKEIAAL